MPKRPWVAVMVIMLLGASAPQAQASSTTGRSLRGGVGAGLIVGDASDFLDKGSGPWLAVERVFGHSHHFGFSIDAQWLFLEDARINFGEGRAHNELVGLSAGPLIGTGLGPLRVHIGGAVGVLSSRWDGVAGESSEAGSQTSFAWSGTLGLEALLTEGDHPWAVVAEGPISKAGNLTFARASDPQGPGPVALVQRDIAVALLYQLVPRVRMS